jgi:hypothetical protein
MRDFYRDAILAGYLLDGYVRGVQRRLWSVRPVLADFLLDLLAALLLPGVDDSLTRTVLLARQRVDAGCVELVAQRGSIGIGGVVVIDSVGDSVS